MSPSTTTPCIDAVLICVEQGRVEGHLVKIWLDEQLRFLDSTYGAQLAMRLQPANRVARLLIYRHHRGSSWRA